MAATKANSIVMTEGRPLPQIIRFSVPLALTGILQLLFNAADVIVVGKFDSSTALAAVGATTSLINLLIGAFIGISVGVNILVARYLGCRDDERVSRSVTRSFKPMASVKSLSSGCKQPLRKAAAAHWQNSSPGSAFRRSAVMPVGRLSAASPVHGRRLKLPFRRALISRSCPISAL